VVLAKIVERSPCLRGGEIVSKVVRSGHAGNSGEQHCADSEFASVLFLLGSTGAGGTTHTGCCVYRSTRSTGGMPGAEEIRTIAVESLADSSILTVLSGLVVFRMGDFDSRRGDIAWCERHGTEHFDCAEWVTTALWLE